MIKKIVVLSFFFFSLILMPKTTFGYTEARPEDCRALNITCTSVNVSFNNISNWSGGDVEVRCKGGQDANKPVPCCIGESATLSPGESATLNKCDCQAGGSECVVIVRKNGQANSCNLDVAGGSCGGTNGLETVTPAFITGSCQAPPGGGGNPPGGGGGNPPGGGGGNPPGGGGGNPPGGNNPPGQGGPEESSPPEEEKNRCDCQYEESCVVNGKEGTRSCTGSSNGDSCEFDGNQCEANCGECQVPEESPGPSTPPATTPPNQCNQECETDDQCVELNTESNCTKCLPTETGGKTCQPPPGQTPRPTPTTPPNRTPPPTPKPTPLPTFNPAMCKCDGVIVGDNTDSKTQVILPGSRAKITALSYVGGLDTRVAEVRDVVFTLVEANGNVGTVLRKSSPIPASTAQVPSRVVSSTVNRVNYAATWDVDIPEGLTKGAVYRIFANTNCVKKRVQALDFLNTAVLGESDIADQGFFAGVSDFFQSLFGIRPKTDTQNSTSSPTPQPSAQNTEELKLRTVQPALILNKACTSITFQIK